ncbi:sensor histidine kinase [Microbacterium cremeum]|uniref:sensor histidine kinase n=1 Tax=Microbacterium cremeum TaxID=2782169 RepID=UPI001887119B|nr:ATP-binding protein [Microbacterium cremeum]
MAGDGQTVLDTAWAQIPRSREATAGIGSFTRSRVERIISIAAASGSVIIGTQAFIAALGSTQERPEWRIPLMVAVFGTLAFMLLACAIGRAVRVASGVFALVYVLALASWPIATAGVVPDTLDEPWIWYLVNLATLAAVLAFPLPLQIAWMILAPLLFYFVRLVQGGFATDFWIAVGLDVSFALILGGVLLTLGWMLRSVAANVDETRARAVSSYAQAAAADAAEQERVAVAALMHDSVLAALIAAERATTPRERTLAAAMAREALTRLANTEQDSHEGTDDPRDGLELADDIEAAAGELGADVDVHREIAPDIAPIPGRVARALTLAATQAVANALQHAGGAGLGVAVIARDGRVRVEVHDAGEGFDLDDIPDDRLGIRASIIARVAAVGGTADLETGSHGTTVRLTWREAAA